MDGYSAQQIIDAEAPLLAAGVPLMARAAKALANIVDAELEDLAIPIGAPAVLMLVGAGNNGGDALYAAKHLSEAGYQVGLLPVLGRIHEEGLKAALDSGATLLAPVGADPDALVEAAEEAAAQAAVVVDGILGTGSAGQAALRGAPKKVVDALLAVQAARAVEGDPLVVVAVDLPSGLDADTGEAPSPTVLPADVTATFGACKAGLLIGRGPELAGDVVEVDIGLKPNLAGQVPKVSR